MLATPASLNLVTHNHLFWMKWSGFFSLAHQNSFKRTMTTDQSISMIWPITIFHTLDLQWKIPKILCENNVKDRNSFNITIVLSKEFYKNTVLWNLVKVVLTKNHVPPGGEFAKSQNNQFQTSQVYPRLKCIKCYVLAQ